MRGLDTNVLVRYLTQDDPVQSRRANAVIADALERGEPCSINAIVLCELIGWRNRESGCSDTATFDRALRGSRLFRVL